MLDQKSLNEVISELKPKDLHFQCDDIRCCAHKSWEEGFWAAVKYFRRRLNLCGCGWSDCHFCSGQTPREK